MLDMGSDWIIETPPFVSIHSLCFGTLSTLDLGVQISQCQFASKPTNHQPTTSNFLSEQLLLEFGTIAIGEWIAIVDRQNTVFQWDFVQIKKMQPKAFCQQEGLLVTFGLTVQLLVTATAEITRFSSIEAAC